MIDGPCRVCGSTSAKDLFECSERMFGTGESFRYGGCRDCGSLVLLDVPTDLSPYYRSDYYSFDALPAVDTQLKRALKSVRTQVVLRGPGPAVRLLPHSWRPAWRAWFRGVLPSHHAPVLDFGCGSGRLLAHLHNEGFRNLAGYDPYLGPTPLGPVSVHRSLPNHLQGTFSIVMMHHSLEHATDPHNVLRIAAELVRPDGCVLVRIPMADSFAWRHYGTDWVQLDPPRHITLFTDKSFRLLANAVGLEVIRAFRDSDGFQFWGSEQLRRGIVLEDSRSLWTGTQSSIFSTVELAAFNRHAERLNEANEGDTGCFLLRRAGHALSLSSTGSNGQE